MRKIKQDVAWGFFWGAGSRMGHTRNLRIMWTRDAARIERRAHYHGHSPGPIFKITPPKRTGKGKK